MIKRACNRFIPAADILVVAGSVLHSLEIIRDGTGLYKKGDPDRQISDRVSCIKSGSFLLSHLPAVPSAQVSLTSLFGMGRGGSSPLLPPQYRSGNRSLTLDKHGAECFGILVQVDFGVTAFTSPAYLRRSLRRPSAKSHPGDGFALRCFQRLS